MKTIRIGDSGAGVEDIQQRLALLGFLDESSIDGTFGAKTEEAIKKFGFASGEVDAKVWSAIVDATYYLGDRTLYLRMPHFHGHDVYQLQTALSALGFFCGDDDGIFGAYTEAALRNFQMNLGIPADGIAGAMTFAALKNLEHSWSGKNSTSTIRSNGYVRASDVLEQNYLCLFGTDDFTRSIASRMSNLALATNPLSKIVSAEMLSVLPEEELLFVNIATARISDSVPTVIYSDNPDFTDKLSSAISMAKTHAPARIRVVFSDMQWLDAGEDRSAQHFAIALLDAICSVL